MQEAPTPPPEGTTSQQTPAAPTPNAQPKILSKKAPKKATLPAFPKPHPSFIVAITTILVTIAAGVALAFLLGSLTQRGMKVTTKDSQTAPVVTVVPTVSREIDEIPDDQGSSPSAESASGSFGSMLEEGQGTPSSSPLQATQPASPN